MYIPQTRRLALGYYPYYPSTQTGQTGDGRTVPDTDGLFEQPEACADLLKSFKALNGENGHHEIASDSILGVIGDERVSLLVDDAQLVLGGPPAMTEYRHPQTNAPLPVQAFPLLSAIRRRLANHEATIKDADGQKATLADAIDATARANVGAMVVGMWETRFPDASISSSSGADGEAVIPRMDPRECAHLLAHYARDLCLYPATATATLPPFRGDGGEGFAFSMSDAWMQWVLKERMLSDGIPGEILRCAMLEAVYSVRDLRPAARSRSRK